MSYLMLIRILAIVAPILLLCSLWWYAGSPRQSQEIGNTSQEVGVKTDEVGQGNTPTVVPKEPKAPVYRVLRVVDGDTLDIQTVGKVRLIGINSPESVKPDTMPECYGKEASEI
jgi:endonuclease YncB( thermonuclease family)